MNTTPSPDEEGGQVVPFPFTPPPVKDEVEQQGVVLPLQAEIDAIDVLPDGQERTWLGCRLLAKYGIPICPVRHNTKGNNFDGLNPAFNASCDPKKIDKWLEPGKGKYAQPGMLPANVKQRPGYKSANTTDGLDSLDLDNLQHDVCKRLMAALEGKAYVDTPSGGRHYPIQPVGAARKCNSRSRAPSTKPGKEGSIVPVAELFTGNGTQNPNNTPMSWPSTLNGVRYQMHSGPVGVLPLWAYDEFDISSTPPIRPGRGITSAGDDIEYVPFVQLRAALYAIDPAAVSHDEWYKTGMAVKTHCPEDGFALWDRWSSQDAARYKPEEFEKRWRSFNRRDVTIGTLKALASAQAIGVSLEEYTNKPKEIVPPDAPDPDDLILQLNERFTEIRSGSSGIVLRTYFDDSGVPIEFRILNTHGLTFDTKNRKHLVSVGSKSKELSEGEIWASHPDRRWASGTIISAAHEPNELVNLYDKSGKKLLNTFVNVFYGWVHQDPQPGDWSDIKYFLHAIIANGDDALYEWHINWLAHMLQYPDEKPGTAPVFGGAEGAGKGTYFDLVSTLINPKHCWRATEPRVFGKFNAKLATSLLVMADEARCPDKLRDDIFSYITDPEITIEGKGADQYCTRVATRFTFATNHMERFRISSHNRRFTLCEVSDKHAGDAAYWDRFHNTVIPDQNEAFARYLLDYAVDRQKVRLPCSTAAESQQKENTADSFTKWAWKLALDNAAPYRSFALQVRDGQPLMFKEDAYASFREYCKLHDTFSGSEEAFGANMRKLGCATVRPRALGSSDRPRAYALPRRAALIKTLVETQYRHSELTDDMASEDWCGGVGDGK